jgi:hypothetical protein
MRYQGILVTDSYAQLRAMLEKRLSLQHALLFAEPLHNSSGAFTDWYTAAEGAAAPLDKLSAHDKSRIAAKISSLASDIGQLAAELMQSPEANKNIRGNILSLALHYPDTGHLYVVGEQPVIICWGFDPGTLGARPEELKRLGSALAAPPPASSGQAGSKSAKAIPAALGLDWLRAVLFFLSGLLLLAGLLLLSGLLFRLAGCTASPALPGGCSSSLPAGCSPAPPSPSPSSTVEANLISSLTAEQEKELSLRRQLDDLRRELQKRAALCLRVPPKNDPPRQDKEAMLPEPSVKEPVLPETPGKEPEASADEEQAPSLADFMPSLPDETEKTPLPHTESKPEKQAQEKAKPQKQARGEEMTIPDAARKNKDVSFLEGCWNSRTDLRSDRTNEPLGVQYCFEANGQGTRSITKPESQDRCFGSARAKFDSAGRLIINSDRAACNKGGGFMPESVECSSADGKADCSGTSSQRKWKARFHRN